MGTKEIESLIEILQSEIAKGRNNNITGTWHIHFEKDASSEQPVFSFNKCESEIYCEERPAQIALDGTVIDEGGPLF
ncbi:MAG: hypothetical protein CL792_05960 [Chloroflexi bacterium]|nr:hypothetical protein [Chloroflexota bacterium]|tara:strand:- start:53 stop:283 length:231 start_codon:yes stop_codon:yes gene_type:complete